MSGVKSTMLHSDAGLIATLIFMKHHLVDYHLGLILALSMFLGAMVGARIAIRLGNRWLRRIFLTAVWILGIKAIFYDLMATGTRPDR